MQFCIHKISLNVLFKLQAVQVPETELVSVPVAKLSLREGEAAQGANPFMCLQEACW